MGWMLVALGLGLLIGVGIEAAFWWRCMALGLMAVGIWVCKGKIRT